jgi:glucokinase
MVGEGGRVRSSVMVDGWQDVPLRAEAQARLGVPCAVDNDGNCAAVAEHLCRGGSHDLLYVSVGTGIGGALVLGGRLWHGVDGLAGEVGHTAGAPGTGPCSCGGRDCLHMVSTSRAIEESLGIEPGGLQHPGDTPAEQRRRERALESSAAAVGVAAANAVNLLAIPLVVIGGGVVRHPGYVEGVQRSFREHAMAEHQRSVRVETAAAGYSAGAVGAAIIASELVRPDDG